MDSFTSGRPASSCAVATDTLCSAANNLISTFLDGVDTTLFASAQGKRVAVCIGHDDGLILSISDGSANVEAWHGTRPQATTTIHIDGVETLQRALRDESAVPGMFLRRKIRVEGNLRWLEELQRATPGNLQTQAHGMKALASEIAASVEDAIRQVSCSSSFASVMWVPDEAASECMNCKERFTIVRRRHHCRSCGRLLCARCAPLIREPDASSSCISSFSSHSSSTQRRKRTCSECRLGCTPSFVGGSARASPSFTQSASSFVMPDGGGMGSQELKSDVKEELDQLRRERKEELDKHVRDEVNQIWFLTQAAIGTIFVLLFWCYHIKSLIAYVACVAYLYCFPSSSLRRYLHIFWAASILAGKLLITRRRIRSSGLKGSNRETEWMACHRILARFVFERMASLGSGWIKIGQQLSNDPALPMPYQDELKKLQDKVPPSPISDVLRTLREEFGDDKSSCIMLDPKMDPLGVASIAQVYRATWRDSETASTRDIVVKVQHRGVERKIRQDWNAAWILAFVFSKYDPESIPDFRPLLSKLRGVSENELDFRLEAANQERARQTVEKMQIDVIIPTVLPQLVGRRAMAMTYVNGCGLGSIEKWQPDHAERVIASLVDHFAVQFALDGHFNADPHSGNLMIERDTGKLVVLDWGMCVTVDTQVSEAFAQVFFASGVNDIWLLIDAMETIGLTFKDGGVFEPALFMLAMRFATRDSQPMMLAKDEAHKAIDVHMSLYENGPDRYRKSPVSTFPGEMVFFGKAIELLYRVSCKLDVSHPLLQTLFRRSYARLLGRHSEITLPLSPHEFLPALVEPAPRAKSAIENDLMKLLREFYRQGYLLGAQLCLTDLASLKPGGQENRKPKIFADFAVGVKGWLELDVVSTNTLFNVMDISKLVLSIILLKLVEKGSLKLNECIARRWPNFGGQSNSSTESSNVTVEHVLSHTAGLWSPLPANVDTLDALLDFEKMMKEVGGVACLEPVGESQRYHHTSFGYLCAGICRHLAKREVADLWSELVDSVSSKVQGLIGQEDMLMKVSKEIAASRGIASIHKCVSSASIDEIGASMERFLGFTSKNTSVQNPVENCTAAIFGREHLLDLSLFSGRNHVPFSCLPGLQAFGTARAVACILHTTAAGCLLSKGTLDDMTRTRKPSVAEDSEDGAPTLASKLGHLLRIDAFNEWGLGVQLVRRTCWDETVGIDSKASAWGHLSQSGSAALVLPGTKPKALALLVNLVDKENSHRVAWAVLRMLENHNIADGLLGA